MGEDYFSDDPSLSMARDLWERESRVRAQRLGVPRRYFVEGAMGGLAALTLGAQLGAIFRRREGLDGLRFPSEDAYKAMAEGGQGTHAPLDWERIGAEALAQQEAVPQVFLGMVRSLENLYAGFGVDQLVHATQTATRAARANASDEDVLICLLHDAAKLISNANHAEVMAAMVRPYVSDGAYQTLRHHMEFQWKHYGKSAFLPSDLRARYAQAPWYDRAARFSDEWDQQAFDPAYPTEPLETFAPLFPKFFGKVPPREHRTAQECR